MTTTSIPLQAVPNQTVKVSLSGQNVILNINSSSYGIFVTVNVNNVDFVESILACHASPLIAAYYEGFAGNLIFFDTQGTDNPVYTGLGTRWLLTYMDATDFATFLANSE